MEDNKEVRQEALKNLINKVKEADELDTIKNAISDNKFQFIVKDINYRVRKPTFKERQLLKIFKAKKRNEFILDPKLKLREELIIEYKKNGIDIEDMDDTDRNYSLYQDQKYVLFQFQFVSFT